MPFKDTKNIDQTPSSSKYKEYIQEGQANTRIIHRNILVINDSNDDRILQEDAPIQVDQFDNVYFQELISYLREQNLILPDSSIFFFDVERNVFVHQGRESGTTSTMIPLKKFNSEEIKIKYRPQEQYNQHRNYFNNHIPQHSSYQTFPQNFHHMQTSSQGSMMIQGDSMFCQRGPVFVPPSNCFSKGSNILSQQQQNQSNLIGQLKEEDDEDNQDVSSKAIPREKRVKERKIGYVYDRVQEWRKYYEMGFLNEQGRLQKVNLDIAASLVGLSRKTLDDYYKYIRKAEQFQFDFKGRADEKIGVLRNFVRDRQKRLNKNDLDDPEDLSAKAEETTSNCINSDRNSVASDQNRSSKNENTYLPPPPPYAHEVLDKSNKQFADASSASFQMLPNPSDMMDEEDEEQEEIAYQPKQEKQITGIIKQSEVISDKISQGEETIIHKKEEEQNNQVKQEYSVCNERASPEDSHVEEEDDDYNFLNDQEMKKIEEEEY